MAKAQKGLENSYERKPDGTIVRYRVVEEVIEVAALEREKAGLEKRLLEINEILGAGEK